MRKPLLCAMVLLVAGTGGLGTAHAYDQPANVAPAVSPGDRAFYNAGRVCVAQMAGLLDAIDAAARGGSTSSYVNAAADAAQPSSRVLAEGEVAERGHVERQAGQGQARQSDEAVCEGRSRLPARRHGRRRRDQQGTRCARRQATAQGRAAAREI